MGYKREKKIFGKGQRVVLDAFTGDGEDSNIRLQSFALEKHAQY